MTFLGDFLVIFYQLNSLYLWINFFTHLKNFPPTLLQTFTFLISSLFFPGTPVSRMSDYLIFVLYILDVLLNFFLLFLFLFVLLFLFFLLQIISVSDLSSNSLILSLLYVVWLLNPLNGFLLFHVVICMESCNIQSPFTQHNRFEVSTHYMRISVCPFIFIAEQYSIIWVCHKLVYSYQMKNI